MCHVWPQVTEPQKVKLGKEDYCISDYFSTLYFIPLIYMSPLPSVAFFLWFGFTFLCCWGGNLASFLILVSWSTSGLQYCSSDYNFVYFEIKKHDFSKILLDIQGCSDHRILWNSVWNLGGNCLFLQKREVIEILIVIILNL